MPDADVTPPPNYGYGLRDAADGLNGADAAISTRRSVRAFLRDKPVPKDLVEHILNVSARAPSGTNVQPWRVTAVAGEARDRICAAVRDKREGGGAPEMGYAYYPTEWFEPYVSRRRKLGWDMYGLLGIGKGDREKTHRQHGRNFELFDAPVGLFFHMDERFERGSFVDMGLFIQNVMISARGHGLDTCPQAAWVDYSDTVKAELNIPDNHILICGMCLGYEDTSEVVNELYSEREAASSFTDWQGFGE